MKATLNVIKNKTNKSKCVEKSLLIESPSVSYSGINPFNVLNEYFINIAASLFFFFLRFIHYC